MNGFLASLNRLVEKKFTLFFLAVLLFSAFCLFYRLDSLPVQNLDESRNGVSAYEMVVNHDFIKTTYLNETDYWNTKPPLLIWLIAFSYQLLGFTVFALRFPSAVFGLGSIVLTMLIAKDYFNKKAALIAGIVLSTSYAFIHFHAARKGDYDSLLAFLILVSIYALMKSERNKLLFYVSGLAAGLAFLTKSFAVVQLFGIIVIYLWLTKKWKKYSIANYLLFIFSMLLPVALWAVFRYRADGMAFFQNMINNDLLERTIKLLNYQPTSPLYYFLVLIGHFFPWSIFIVFAFFYQNEFSTKIKEGRRQLKMKLNSFFNEPAFIIWIAVPFILFSMVNTRLDWYINPIMPPLAVMTGWVIAEMLDQKPRGRFGPARKIALAFSVPLLALVFQAAALSVIHSQDQSSDQHFLMDFPGDGHNRSFIYYVNRGEFQSPIFIARVIKHYQVLRSDNYDYYFKNAGANDLLLLDDNDSGKKLIAEHQLKALARGNGYIMAGK